MTCESMRERLLAAELAELDGIGSSPVAAHVRECARCRAIADQLLADTRLLGAEVERLSVQASARVERVSRRRYLAIGTLAAAALAFVVVTRSARRDVAPVVPVITLPVRNTEPPRVARASVPSTPAAENAGGARAAESAPIATTKSVAAPSASRRPLAHAVQPRPLPAAQRVEPTPLAPRSVTHPLVVADAQP